MGGTTCALRGGLSAVRRARQALSCSPFLALLFSIFLCVVVSAIIAAAAVVDKRPSVKLRIIRKSRNFLRAAARLRSLFMRANFSVVV